MTHTSFQPLDAGYKTQDSLHFEVSAYGIDNAQNVSNLAERFYQHIMNDTGLYSFMPPGLYPLMVYANHDEYLRKTGMPPWSGGVSVGNSIYTYEGPQLPGVVAHEMTHLIFHEFMLRDRDDLRWLNEGLAVYEEQEADAVVLGHPVNWAAATPGGFHPVPFSQMMSLAPMSEESRAVNSWYIQVGSVVRFMIERGGNVGFSQFLKGIHDGVQTEDSLRAAFPGIWSSFNALETAWRNQ